MVRLKVIKYGYCDDDDGDDDLTIMCFCVRNARIMVNELNRKLFSR